MTFGRQVVHLVRRELRRLVPWLLLSGVVLTVTVVRATESTLLGSGAVPTSAAVFLCLAFASLWVLADSPIREDAYWATLPMDGRALAVAKLLAVGVLIAGCETGLLVVLNAWRYPITTAAEVVSTSLVVLYAWSLGVAIVASVCAHRGLAVLVIGGVILFAQLFGGSIWLPGDIERSIWALATLALLGVGSITFISIYRWRPTSRAARGGTLVIGALLLFVSSASPPRTPSSGSKIAGSNQVALRLVLGGQPECDAQAVTIPLAVTSPPWVRVDLTRPQTTLYLNDGDSIALANTDWMQSAGLWGSLVPPALFRGTLDDEGAASDRRVRRTDIAFLLPAEIRDRVCGRIARVDLRLQVRLATGAELMRLPLVTGAAGAAPGLRLRIRDAGRRDSAPSITADVSSLTGLHGQLHPVIADLEFALLQPRGVVVRLDEQAQDRLSRTADFPGIFRVSRTQRMGIERTLSPTRMTRVTTIENAQLVVVAPVWSTRAERRVTAEVPPTLAARPDASAAGPRW